MPLYYCHNIYADTPLADNIAVIVLILAIDISFTRRQYAIAATIFSHNTAIATHAD